MKKFTTFILFIIAGLMLSGCYRIKPEAINKYEAVEIIEDISETEAPVREAPKDYAPDTSFIFDEARIDQGNGNIWTVKIDSYEKLGSMFYITTDTGAAILVHETNCILYKYAD
jgi:hypothetical protein